MDNILKQFPAQMKPDSEKTEKWKKDCVDAGITLSMFSKYNKHRSSRDNKVANYNLYDDKLDTSDVKRTMNPFGIRSGSFPAKMQNYPIANSKIQLLVGEESKRRFDFKVTVINPDAVSQKEKALKDMIIQFLQESIMNPEDDEETLQKKLKDLDKWRKYEYQDLREKTADNILRYYWYTRRLPVMFNQGFKDALISGEEIYNVDVLDKDLEIRRVNTLDLYTVGSSKTNRIEDSDVIAEVGYFSLGWVIDHFYDELKPSQIKTLESSSLYKGGAEPANSMYARNLKHPDVTLSEAYNPTGQVTTLTSNYDLINFDHRIRDRKQSTFDAEGNIRVVKVVWKSRRKIGRLKYYDELGEEQNDIVPENYTPDETVGEEVTWLWINEWWEGYKIGEEIYLKIRPRPIRFKSMDNLTVGGPGYVGTIYNTNDGAAISLMDRMKPYQYMYNVLGYRTEEALAKYTGPMIEIDLAKVPEGWSFDKWMYYGRQMGILVIDSFSTSKEGPAKGKLAGVVGNTSGKIYNPDMGQYIVNNLNMMSFIENQLGQVAGVTKQREGQIDNRETVGGVERAVTQSSHITEEWFMLHEETKIRVLETILETAKQVFKYLKPQKLQYITDELATVIFDLDGDMFAESDYAVAVVNSPYYNEMMQSLKQLAQAGIQNDKLNFSAFMDLYMDSSISSVRRKIERYEEDREQAAQKGAEEDRALMEKKYNDELALRTRELDIKDREVDIKELDIMQKLYDEMDSEDTTSMTDKEREELDIKKKALESNIKNMEEKLTLERNKLNETERSNREKEKIARIQKNRSDGSK